MRYTNDLDAIDTFYDWYKENKDWSSILLHYVNKGVDEFYEAKHKHPDRMFFSDVDFPQLLNKKIHILGIEVMATPLIQSGTMICVDSHALTIYD